MRHLIFLFILLIAAGCGVTSQGIDVSKRSRTFSTDRDGILKAVLAYCTEKGFPIASVNEQLGLVNTDFKAGETMGLPMVGNTRVKISFVIQELSGSSTRLVANLSIQKHGVSTWTGTTDDWADVESTEGMMADAYKELFKSIEAYLPKE